jgi:hypothetical protein
MKGLAGILAAVLFGTLVATTTRPAAQVQAPGPGGSPRASAPVDLTGTWVSVVNEDWAWRMRTPPPGDYPGIPLNAEGQKVANAWDPALDGRCEAYGVGGLMRMPTRLRISWENDTMLRIETDAGRQTRLLRFAPQPPPSGPRTLQGHSVADWLRGGRGQIDPFTDRPDGPGVQPWGQLRVVTTHMRAGWLRRNGVPYSEQAVITEHFIRISHPVAGEWFVVNTIVNDPRYLQQPFITSTNFRREADDSGWNPTSCRS